MQNKYTIRLETKSDYNNAENLTREAFWNVYRPGCLEHYVLHTFRSRPDFVPELDFVMEQNGKLIGHIMYVRSEICADDGRVIPIMTFGPISIAPECKRKGYGTILLRYSMNEARKLGVGALAITGNINFYGKSGFTVASTKGIHYYAEPREAEVPYFLICELKPGFLNGVSGVYKDPEGYFVDEKEAEDFDAKFPQKEKLKLSGQIF
ncbi:GNAT family N-acetyltransferase [Caproicibacterium sp. BJN0003]|uniref:GNAT family N-acetyltransferase n=1 Tax=Caproicibacterium sp. BJN0003 TaxID=2994078 RepID=UPI0022536873|nr:N-acetyltransferase [Caproicibacterium sp. BJN0003]UZT81778.1 N-acetyltransferase [Caproicibacterium sp. BJN0003]